MLLSIVSNTSNRLSASASSAPLLRPAQPIKGTDSTVRPGKSRHSRPSRFSSRRIFTQAGCNSSSRDSSSTAITCSRFTLGKPSRKIIDGISRLQMVEKALDWHACSDKDWRAPQNLRVRTNDGCESHETSLLRYGKPLKAPRCVCGFRSRGSASPFPPGDAARVPTDTQSSLFHRREGV